MFLESIGWIGGLFLAMCGLPQAWQSWRTGHSEGLSNWFLWLWFWGEVLVLIYVLPKGHLPLIVNYIGNLFIIVVILWYKYKPRKQ